MAVFAKLESSRRNSAYIVMGKKDKKSKTAEQKARVAAKQNKRATQKEKKVKSKGADDSDADDIDLDEVLEEYKRQVWSNSIFNSWPAVTCGSQSVFMILSFHQPEECTHS